MKINLTILGRPVTKKNHGRRIKRGNKIFHVPSEAYEKWAIAAKPQIWRQIATACGPIAYPLNLSATIYRGAKVGDLINYLQAVQDILQDAGAIEDDKWIVSLDGCRMAVDYANPRVEIELTRYE